ncbi:hypothetical protein ACFE04_007358 [Oxalis oulophora]
MIDKDEKSINEGERKMTTIERDGRWWMPTCDDEESIMKSHDETMMVDDSECLWARSDVTIAIGTTKEVTALEWIPKYGPMVGSNCLWRARSRSCLWHGLMMLITP